MRRDAFSLFVLGLVNQDLPILAVGRTGNLVLEQAYSVDTGKVLTINTKKKALYDGEKELSDISSALTPQKVEFIRAGAVVPQIVQPFLPATGRNSQRSHQNDT